MNHFCENRDTGRSLSELKTHLIHGDLGEEVGALVLIDELSDPFGLKLASLGESIGVGLVWQAEIEMMSRVFNVDDKSLIIDLLGDATSVPRVEATVREDDIGSLHEVALRDASAEVIEGEIVLRRLAVCSNALSSVFFLIPSCGREHRGLSIASEWHHHLVASLDAPAVAIKAATLINRDVKAVKLLLIVVENSACSLDSIKRLEQVTILGIVSSLGLLA